MIDPQSLPPRSDGPVEADQNLDSVVAVRSEEQLRISTVSVPTERIRFEKVIVTEERAITVTVRREELRVIREPLGTGVEAGTGAPQAAHDSPSTRELDIVLHEEQVLVTTRTVPVERVTVRVRQTVEDLAVTDTVRKERIAVSAGPAHSEKFRPRA